MKHKTRIKELCEERGLSVAKIERMACIPPKSISGWDKSEPSADKLEKVIKALGITRDEYYGEQPITLDITNSVFGKLMYQMIEEDLGNALPSDEEFKMLARYRKASDRDKQLIDSILSVYAGDEP